MSLTKTPTGLFLGIYRERLLVLLVYDWLYWLLVTSGSCR